MEGEPLGQLDNTSRKPGAHLLRVFGPDFSQVTFLGFAQGLFLAFHAPDHSPDDQVIRPYLSDGLRARYDSGRGVAAGAAASVDYLRVVGATREHGTDSATIRFAAEDPGAADGRVHAEEWAFERPTRLAETLIEEPPVECPICGGPTEHDRVVCEFCGQPLANGGWRVVRIEKMRLGSSGANPVAVAIIAALILVIAAVVFVLVGRGVEREKSGSLVRDTTRQIGNVAVNPDFEFHGLTGTAVVVLDGPLTVRRTGRAVASGGTPKNCLASSVDITGLVVVADSPADGAGSVLVSADLPGGARGPGVYGTKAAKVNVSVGYSVAGPDGTLGERQSWTSETATPTAPGAPDATMTVEQNGNVRLEFSGLTPRSSSSDPLLNAPLVGRVDFTCER